MAYKTIKNAKLQKICSYSQSHFENWRKLDENRVLKIYQLDS